ncbi:MAG: serine/threonine-protein phosphatase [Phycisphaerales bacterium]|nr:serine/threonine-protein phosphatase [Phycisphaerales bacterium]
MAKSVSQNPTQSMDYIELLREASEAGSLAEYGYRLLRRMRELFGAECFANFAAAEDQPHAYHILSVVELPEGELDPDVVFSDGRWGMLPRPIIEGSALLVELASHQRPAMLEPRHPADAALQKLCGHEIPPYAVVLPTFRGGRADEWCVFFRSSPWDLAEDDVLVLTQLANMMGLAGEREELVERVSGLNDRLSSSLESILDAQRSIIPPQPPSIDGLRFAVWYEPSEEVGGDYYDFRDFGRGQFGAVVADVSGHGPPASVAMGMLRSVLMAYRAFNRPASTVVTDVNTVLYESLNGERFVTAIFVAFYPKNGRFVYANAGHHVPRVRRSDGRVEPITGNASPPLGILEHLETVGASGQLQPGECMVLYTDGVIEAFDSEHNLFGVDRLDEAIAQADPDPDAIAESIRVAVGAFSEEQIVDDRCVLVVMREP